MIQEKDASTPCDERHVKYRRCNTNLLTQKNIGGKRIMGNQGAKNWKLTALFAISLMLIAGLFTNAAIARDGSGTASVTWATTPNTGFDSTDTDNLDAVFRGSHTLYEYLNNQGGLLANDIGFLDPPLPAGSRENQLMFSYFVDVNMAGGQVEIRLPSGWMIQTAAENILGKDGTADNDLVNTDNLDAYLRYSGVFLVEIHERFDGGVGAAAADSTPIYVLNRDGKNVALGAAGEEARNGAALTGVDLAAQTDRATVDGSSVTVNLSNAWRSGGELVVILRNVETVIPRSLRNKTTAEDTIEARLSDLPYANSTISVKSKRSGRLDTLDPVSIDDDGDDPDDDGKIDRRRDNVPTRPIRSARSYLLSGLEISLVWF